MARRGGGGVLDRGVGELTAKGPGFVSRLDALARRLGTLTFRGNRPEDSSDHAGDTPDPAGGARPDGLVLWFLADTAAEAGPGPAIAEELSRRLGEPVHLLLTTAKYGPLCPGVAGKALHRPVPAEASGEVMRFLEHWRPDFAIVVGAPARPVLIGGATQKGLPVFHAFAERKPDGPGKFPSYLAGIDTCLAPSAAVANQMRTQFKAGKTRVEISGPLSDTVYALHASDAEADTLAAAIGGRPIWLASGIAPDEVSLIEAAHRKAFRSAHRLLLLVVPRSPGEADIIARRFEDEGWSVSRRSNDEEPGADTQVFVADEADELGLWYRLAPVSFMGGTLHPDNTPADPFAPAALGSAVLHGPFTGAAPWRYQRLDSQNASVLVHNAEELGEAIITLFAPDKAASLAQAGWAVTTESAHVVERLAELMEERLTSGEDAH